MANDLNRCEFIGRLGSDPEQRFMPAGSMLVRFSIAVNWKSKEKEGCEWVNIVIFGKLAEICSQYLKKGDQIFIAGRLRTQKYQDKSGQDRYSTEIVGEEMIMLGGKGGDKPAASYSGQSSSLSAGQRTAASGPAASYSDYDDDIPFMRLQHEYLVC